MTAKQMFLQVAKDEAETLAQYDAMLSECEDATEEDKAKMLEIMGDEFNHCLIALFTASNKMGVEIPSDGIENAMTGVTFKEEDDDANQS